MKKTEPKRSFKMYHGVPGIIMVMNGSEEYTRTEKGQIVRVNRDHRTKKERNSDKKLRRRVA